MEVFRLYYELEEHLSKKNTSSEHGIYDSMKPGEERTITKGGKTQIIRRLN